MIIKQAENLIPTMWGKYQMIAYAESANDPMPHIALIHENSDLTKTVIVRIHSECMTGDVFGSFRCDCGEQLHKALSITSQQGGIVLYLRQEGRGIGIINKLKAYNLQDHGINTADANTHLGFEVDARTYEVAISILVDLGVKTISLLTNNPAKIDAFENSLVDVVNRIPLEISPKDENRPYLQTKKDQMGHLLNFK